MPNVSPAIAAAVVENQASFQWVAHPDSGTGTRPKRHSFLKFPFLAVMLVPGQQRLTVFCVLFFWVLRPHPVFQVLWQVQVLSWALDTLRIVDHKVDGAFCGAPPPAVTPHAVSGVGAKLDESELQDAQVQASGGENVGVFHVHNLLGNINRSRRASGWKTCPTLRGGSGSVLPAQRTQRNRCVRGRRDDFATSL